MAVSGGTEPVAVKTQLPSPTVKKPRKNPARRKAERSNTNTTAEPVKGQSASNTAPSAAPAPLTRQASAPSVLSNASASHRPTLPNGKSSVATPSSGPNNNQIPRAKDTATAQQQGQSASLIAQPRPLARRSNTTSSSLAFNAPAFVTGGLIGCAAGAAILMAVHVWYDFAGVKAAVATARAARICVDNLSEELITSMSAGTYSTDEALDILRRTTLAYASTIPDGGPVVERIFREIAAVRQSRGAEVDKVLAGAYDELRAAGNKGCSAVETRNIVLKHLVKLSLFASRATQDVLTRNPRLKPLRDGAVKALKEPPRAKVPSTKVNLVVKHK